MVRSKIVAVIPALNEEKAISKVIRGVKKYVDEIILIDDASSDKTAVIAEQEGAIILSHTKNQGYDKSLDDGFALAAKRGATIILTFDGDGQHNPEDIPKIVEPILKDEADVVVGKRPHYSRITEYLFAFIARIKANIDDPLCGLKAYHINVYKDIGYFDRVSSIGTQLMLNAKKRGYNVVQKNITLNERSGTSRFGRRAKANWRILKAIIRTMCWGIETQRKKMGKRGELGMNFDLQYVNCDLCGKSATRIYATVSYMDYLNRRPELESDADPILKNEELANYKFSLAKCKNCGLIYVNPRLTEKSLANLYQEQYFSHYANIQSEGHKKRQETFKVETIELERLTKKLKVGREILDVGCGGGFFLASLNNSWKKYGTEINPAAVKYGRDTFGLDILKGHLREVNFSDETFDVIKIRGTIEHLPDPMGELRQIYRILRKEGLIAVNTPNIESICARIYKEKFRIVCPTAHIYYFSTKTLSLMLKKVGFKVVKVSYHYFDTPYASWRDPAKILLDLATLKIFRDHNTTSPPFYGNIVDIYACRESPI